MGRKLIDKFMDMVERDFGDERIRPGSVCVLWAGSHTARLVRVTRKDDLPEFGRDKTGSWYTRPYLDQGYPEKRVHEDELTLLTNEMEILAWAAKLG